MSAKPYAEQYPWKFGDVYKTVTSDDDFAYGIFDEQWNCLAERVLIPHASCITKIAWPQSEGGHSAIHEVVSIDEDAKRVTVRPLA